MKNIFIAGHQGMVGSAILKALQKDPTNNFFLKNRDELDLLDRVAVRKFFTSHDIDYVYLAAAKVGGILANNNYPADFIFENIVMQSNVIFEAYSAGIKNLLFLGSSCIYPKFSEQPIKEEYLLSGVLEPTNEAYAIAKIAGIKMCQSLNKQFGTDYRCVMPTNLYGPRDNFNLENSHVIPALIHKIHHAKEHNHPTVSIWGSGNALREFLHVDDMAEGAIFISQIDHKSYQNSINECSHINIGSGKDISIGDLAVLIKKIIGFEGSLSFDASKPDGTPRKLLDVTRINNLGWSHRISLDEGIYHTYNWYLQNKESLRR